MLGGEVSKEGDGDGDNGEGLREGDVLDGKGLREGDSDWARKKFILNEMNGNEFVIGINYDPSKIPTMTSEFIFKIATHCGIFTFKNDIAVPYYKMS